MNISGYYPESINEGSGLRAVVYISGCRHRCPGCFNPETWNFNYGEPFTLDRQMEIIKEIKGNKIVKGLTLCGGDPFFSALEVVEFVLLFKEHCPDRDIWAYSGFTYEQIMANLHMRKLLNLCDVLIDGRFIVEEKDITLRFRGSRNQRVIDVKRSSIGNIIEVQTG